MRGPELSDEIREQAKLAGGGWLDEVVGSHPPGGVPVQAIKGSWRLDANGELTGEYVANPGFAPADRPAPRCPFHARRS